MPAEAQSAKAGRKGEPSYGWQAAHATELRLASRKRESSYGWQASAKAGARTTSSSKL
jgi:hypothetical protein